MGSTKRGGSNRGQRGRRGGGTTGGKRSSIGARHPVNDQLLSDDNEEDFMLLGQLGDTTDSGDTDDELTDGRSKHARRKAKIKKAQDAKRTGSHMDTGKEKNRITASTKDENDKSNVDAPHFVRPATRSNDATANDSDTDDNERYLDLNNLLLDVGNLEINDDAFEQLLHKPSPLAETGNCSNDKRDISVADMTDDDIIQILLMCETDKDMHRFLGGLDVDELDRIDAFFEHYDDEHYDDDDDDFYDYDDDILDCEEQDLAELGLFDDYDDEIAPEMFQRALEEALAQVPTGLKPGVKNWLSHDKGAIKKYKQQEKKQQKKEAKANKRYQNKKDTNASGGNPSNTPSTELWNMDRRIIDFINDTQLNSLQFAPMDKISRRQLHTLSIAYNLTSKSLGQGKLRSLVVTKTANTCIPQDRRNIELFIHEAQSTITVQQNLAQKHHQAEPRGHGKGKKANPGKKPVGQDASTSKKKGAAAKQDKEHGTVVASNAAPIAESNVGHRMMLAMGWKQGNGLGTNQEGIIDPIEAVIRGKRRGLGA